MNKILFLISVLFSNLIVFSQTLPVIFPYAHMARAMAIDSKDNLIVTVRSSYTSLWKIAPDGKTSTIIENFDKVKTSNNEWLTCKVLTVDKNDNIYMASDNLIWKVALDGVVSLFAGQRYKITILDGNLTTAQFRNIEFMKADPNGNIIVVEKDNSNKDNLGDFFTIRKITTDGKVKTITDTRTNPAIKSKYIAGMGVDSSGNIYLSDGDGRCIKKISTDGSVTTIAGLCNKREFNPLYIQGDISKAELMSPDDIIVNKKGEVIFSDERLHRLIKIADKKVATVAGCSVIQPNSVNIGGRAKEGYKDGKAMTALFNFPEGSTMAIDSKQNIYILEPGNYAIRKLSAVGMVSTFARRIKD